MPMPSSTSWSTGPMMTFGDSENQQPFPVTHIVEVQEAIESLMDEHTETVKDDTDDIKNSLILEPTGYPVEVYVIAYNRSGRKNMCQKIPCKRTKPLGNWCYDLQTDQFLVDCAGYQHLGRFAQGYRLRMDRVEGWAADIPIPATMIEKKLSAKNREAFDEFKKKYSEKDHNFSFIQCSGVFHGEE